MKYKFKKKLENHSPMNEHFNDEVPIGTEFEIVKGSILSRLFRGMYVSDEIVENNFERMDSIHSNKNEKNMKNIFAFLFVIAACCAIYYSPDGSRRHRAYDKCVDQWIEAGVSLDTATCRCAQVIREKCPK